MTVLWAMKKIVSIVFRFITKPMIVLSFMWITKKLFEKTSGLKQNQLWFYLFYGPPENALGSKWDQLTF
jgi:hypothetical protein